MNFSADRIYSLLNLEENRPSVFTYSVSDSTNKEIRGLAGDIDGDIIAAADSQREGRGTHGRSFYSPDGTGFYVSFGLRGIAEDYPITMGAGVAAVRAIYSVFGIKTSIKWVNDILYKGRKAGGILCERMADGTVIVGIGINLEQPEGGFPNEIRSTATALEADADSKNELAAAVYIELIKLPRDNKKLIADYSDLCYTIGKTIRVIYETDIMEGYATGLGEKGELMVTASDGRELVLSSGYASIRHIE